jgi:transposase
VASYSRRILTDSEVTKEEHHSITNCPDCGEPFTKKTTIIHYEEDIIPPTKERKLKEVTRHTTEKGWCTSCKRWHCALAPPYTKDSSINYLMYLLRFNSIIPITMECVTSDI